jgi:hydrogenase expression/formation protein HypD
MLVDQIEKSEAGVEIAYRRGVRPEGNPAALALMERVFEPSPANWRGMGKIPDSGLKLRPEYQAFDAELAFEVAPEPAHESEGCLCGEILRGVNAPEDCALFAKACTPEHPVGPCMVSSEGSCSAHYLFGRSLGR